MSVPPSSSGELKRGLKNRHIQLIALGGAIGTGLFLGSAGVLKSAGPSMILGYAICGFIAFMIMRQLGEMIVEEPVAGSFSHFAHKYWGGFAGFLSGWNCWILYILVGMSELTAVGKYVHYWWPEFLRKENANHVPVNALWLTNAMVQLFLVITLFSASTYLSLIYLATSMILVPYLWSAAYALLLAVRGETYENALKERKKDLFIGAIALIYAIWLLYAGGTKYLLLSALLYAPGAILFAKAKRELGKPIFTNVEKLIFAAVVIGALVAAYGLYDGFLTL